MSHNIRQKLQGIQSSLKAPKGQTNKFGGYKYRSCEDILTALKPLLQEWGCSLVIKDDIVELGVSRRVYVKAEAFLYDNVGFAYIQANGFAREGADLQVIKKPSLVFGRQTSHAWISGKAFSPELRNGHVSIDSRNHSNLASLCSCLWFWGSYWWKIESFGFN